ncbi:hypothetical protein [Streptomyces canus]|uniref:hypothetical protein n=1 Tax=Streptomyces canus TaxID=58343 RepID=UPI0030DF4C8E
MHDRWKAPDVVVWLISWAFVSGVLWLGGQLMSDLPHLLWCVFGGGVTGALRPLWHCGGTSTEGLQLGPHREELRKGRILPVISRKGAPNIKSLGKLRCVVEQTFALLHQFKRLAVPWERRTELHDAFVSLACGLICWRRLKKHRS